jgi:hypothetical protein
MPTTTELECIFPSCTRPVGVGEPQRAKMCTEHFREMVAREDVDAWEEARHLRLPWLEAAKAIGHAELILAMEESLERVDEEIAQAEAELAQAQAAL